MAVLSWCGLSARPPGLTGRASLAQTWRSNRLLWSSAPRRYAFLALWIPNGLIVGCEALFVSYSPRHAGLMYAFTALGMLAGDTLAGRFIPAAWRRRLAPWLRLLLAVPYLVFALHPAFPVAVAAATVASIGYSASLMLQERLVRLTPDELNGHVLGLQFTGHGRHAGCRCRDGRRGRDLDLAGDGDRGDGGGLGHRHPGAGTWPA